MGLNRRGERDGTGPHKDSAQRQVSNEGKRKKSGETCPKEKSNDLTRGYRRIDGR